MGGMSFSPKTLGDTLSETAGYKAGLALSIEEIYDHLSGTSFPDLIRLSEQSAVRIRSEEYAELFYKLLHRIGFTKEFDGDITGAKLFHKYKNTARREFEGVLKLWVDIWPHLIKDAKARKSKVIDPSPFLEASFSKYGRIGLEMAIERLEVLNKALNLSPYSTLRYTEWNSVEKLESLFKGGHNKPKQGIYIDQRYIDYLSKNTDKLSTIHWRKFEELTAEYFVREGFQVELGPGSNDDGVDVRIWRPEQITGDSPHCVIQCKRQKQKIEKVVIKGLYSDVLFEQAEFGLIVTTSELSPGARTTISARGYPIEEINNAKLREWLAKLRTPGTGIVRV